MDYISVKDWAAAHGVSERTARNYCAHGKIEGACLIGKTWSIPADALFPAHGKHKSEMPLLTVLRREMEAKLKGGLYHRVRSRPLQRDHRLLSKRRYSAHYGGGGLDVVRIVVDIWIIANHSFNYNTIFKFLPFI